MLGYIAAVIFAIAFVLLATTTAVTNAAFQPQTLIAAGLACLALHLAGVGTGWSLRR